ncbi:MAG: ATP-binding protein [Flavobacteriaceae bacterium]|nr:ATP-binding protein [Flavobacteriaceae bacterium]
MKTKKSYSFAFWTSSGIALSVMISSLLLVSVFHLPISFLSVLGYAFFVFVIAFFIIQFRVQRFVYHKIEEIYKKIPFFSSEEFLNNKITSDIKTFSKEMQKYVDYNNLKIQSLHERENYRREFLGNISHELKTPLFTVQGYILTLLEGGAIKDKKIRNRYLKRANKGVDRLIAIVKDLDLISKLESENLMLNKKPFDIIDLIKEVFDMLEIKARKKNISLSFDKNYPYPVIVFADVERIEQVIINLVVNSIKYGKGNGHTTVSISSNDNETIVISVKDNGTGLSESDQQRIFERFFRVDKSRSREQGGSGLGLSIVKHIIEAHQQHISVESELGKGSIFSFSLEKYIKL